MSRRRMTDPGRHARPRALAELQQYFFGPDAYDWWKVLDAGWVRFRDEFKPRVKACVQHAADAPELAAQALYVLGDVYCYAYSAESVAERTYRRAVQIWPRHLGAWDELAQLCERSHRPRAAKRAYEQVLAIEPENEDARRCLKGLDFKCKPGADLPVGLWERIPDLLARERPHLALRLLLRSRTYSRQLLLARVYGMLGDAEKCWERICASTDHRDGLSFDALDWFMYPDAIWESLAFWRLLYRRRQRIDVASHFPFDATIDDVVPRPRPYPKFASRHWDAWQRRRITTQIRLRIERIERGDPTPERLRPRIPFGADVCEAFTT